MLEELPESNIDYSRYLIEPSPDKVLEILDKCEKKLQCKIQNEFPDFSEEILKTISGLARDIMYYTAKSQIRYLTSKEELTDTEIKDAAILLKNCIIRKQSLKTFRKYFNTPYCTRHVLGLQECIDIFMNDYRNENSLSVGNVLLLSKYFKHNANVCKEINTGMKDVLREFKKKLVGKPMGGFPSNASIESYTRNLFPVFIAQAKQKKNITKNTLFGLAALYRRGRTKALSKPSEDFWSCLDEELALIGDLTPSEKKKFLAEVLKEDREKYKD